MENKIKKAVYDALEKTNPTAIIMLIEDGDELHNYKIGTISSLMRIFGQIDECVEQLKDNFFKENKEEIIDNLADMIIESIKDNKEESKEDIS